MEFFSALFDKLIIQLSYSSTPELIDLLTIPGVKIGRARQLYGVGYCRIVDVAQATEGNSRYFTRFLSFYKRRCCKRLRK